MIIDNVGLYRLFGLPTADRDWQAMFEGRLAGKGYPATNARAVAYMTATQAKDETVETVGQLETVVSHGQLLEYLRSGAYLPKSNGNHSEELKSFKDRQSGLWGLRQEQWKSHATLTLLAKLDLPTFGYNMIDPLKSWCWGQFYFTLLKFPVFLSP